MKLVVIRKFENLFLANILQSKLKDAGIQSFVEDENSTIVTHAISNVKLMVKDSDEADARRLLEEMDKNFKDDLTCPNCGSPNIHLQSQGGTDTSITGIISSYFTANPTSETDLYKCDDCGYETAHPNTPSTDPSSL